MKELITSLLSIGDRLLFKDIFINNNWKEQCLPFFKDDFLRKIWPIVILNKEFAKFEVFFGANVIFKEVTWRALAEAKRKLHTELNIPLP